MVAKLDPGVELSPGTAVGEWIVERKIGEGGCSTVYLVEHRDHGRRAALKLLRPDMAQSREGLERFLQETRAIDLIKHPNVIDIYDVGVLPDGRPYFAMELFDGDSLASWIKTHGRTSLAEVLEILDPICAALGAAHEVGIVHRDVKASNIVFIEAGQWGQIKLLDFGIAKLSAELNPSMQTAAGAAVGTPQSMAPEQILGQKIDARVDIYALGVLTFLLLTGDYPFRADKVQEILTMHRVRTPPRPSERAPVPKAVDAVVQRCMAKLPEQRYSSVASFLQALREAVGTHVQSVQRATEAVAIYVEGRLHADAEREVDDELLDDLMTMIDTAEQALVRANYQLCLVTARAVLGIRLLSSGPGEAELEIQGALHLARLVREELSSLGLSMHINVVAHVDTALVRATDADVTRVEGPITDLASWAPDEDLGAACATRACADKLSWDPVALLGERFITIPDGR